MWNILIHIIYRRRVFWKSSKMVSFYIWWLTGCFSNVLVLFELLRFKWCEHVAWMKIKLKVRLIAQWWLWMRGEPCLLQKRSKGVEYGIFLSEWRFKVCHHMKQQILQMLRSLFLHYLRSEGTHWPKTSFRNNLDDRSPWLCLC